MCEPRDHAPLHCDHDRDRNARHPRQHLVDRKRQKASSRDHPLASRGDADHARTHAGPTPNPAERGQGDEGGARGALCPRGRVRVGRRRARDPGACRSRRLPRARRDRAGADARPGAPRNRRLARSCRGRC
eukprot:Amastigsp_a174929_674.p3 type:complete len:131 gc:universal Amastigsp_a174929_674:444-52(-)